MPQKSRFRAESKSFCVVSLNFNILIFIICIWLDKGGATIFKLIWLHEQRVPQISIKIYDYMWNFTRQSFQYQSSYDLCTLVVNAGWSFGFFNIQSVL